MTQKRLLKIITDVRVSFVSACNQTQAFIASLPDTALSASTVWDENHDQTRSRLNTVEEGILRGAWVARNQDTNQWIQVDLQSAKTVTKVETQGRNVNEQWVTSYQLATSLTGDEADFEYVTSSADGAVVTFNANSDRDTIVSNSFSPRVARFVRLYPQAWNTYIALRWEVFRCGCGPITIENAFVNTSDIMVGAHVRIECGAGFVLQDESSGQGSLDVECGVDGEWNHNLTQVSCDGMFFQHAPNT